MAHFYGTVQGARGEGTRLGTKNSGMMTTACSYEGKVRVTLNYCDVRKCDIATVELARHMGKGVEHVLFEGPVGEKPADNAMPGLMRAAKELIAFAATTPADAPKGSCPDDIEFAEEYGMASARHAAAVLIRRFFARVGVSAPGIEGKPADACLDCCIDSDEYYVLDKLPGGGTRCPNCKAEHRPECGQCEGTGTIEGGLSGDGDDEECPVCDGTGELPDDADLAEAAEGDICTGCGRASIDCSRNPCADVLADRGEI